MCVASITQAIYFYSADLRCWGSILNLCLNCTEIMELVVMLINSTCLNAFTGGIFQGKYRETGFISLFFPSFSYRTTVPLALNSFCLAASLERSQPPAWLEGCTFDRSRATARWAIQRKTSWGWFHKAFSVCQGGDPKMWPCVNLVGRTKLLSGSWQVLGSQRCGVMLCILCSGHAFIFFHADV